MWPNFLLQGYLNAKSLTYKVFQVNESLGGNRFTTSQKKTQKQTK